MRETTTGQNGAEASIVREARADVLAAPETEVEWRLASDKQARKQRRGVRPGQKSSKVAK